MTRIIALIPAYNESLSIGEAVRGVLRHVSEVIVIDDGSSDNTTEQASSAGALVITHALNRGQGAALQTGTELALARHADIIIHFDADGQMNPSQIPVLIRPLLKGPYQVSLGSRFLMPENSIAMPLHKKVVHRLLVQVHWIFTGIKLTDVHCGFRALTAYAARQLVISHNRMAHASELEYRIAQYALPFIEIPISIRYTDYSKQKSMPLLSHAWQILRDITIHLFLKRK